MFKKLTKPKHKRWSSFGFQQAIRKCPPSKRETMIVFVYDTECLKDEADDPVSAVLYFHPSWVSDTQKVALCGQLMGTSYFLKDCFFKPSIIALQNGKFVLKEFGRFILAVGTDRNISDYLLKHRADLLTALIKFYHRDLQTIFDQFSMQGELNNNKKNLSEKLYHIFETYLPILQYNGNIFHNIPKLRMPKTASNIFLDAIQTLQCCQQTKGILGGAILYHNKVVATQLSDAITKNLVLTDPLHVRTTAEHIAANDYNLHIPNGVQMIVVYVEMVDYKRLCASAQRAQNLQTTQLSHFQYAAKGRKMKRDKSLIFTHIPEEVTTSDTDSSNEPLHIDETVHVVTRPKSLLIRPTNLPLRLKNMNSKELPESGIASINFDETDSYPEFIGRTSVCSTPMAENKVLNVGNIMSICANPNDDEKNSNNKEEMESDGKHKMLGNRKNSLKMDVEKFFQNLLTNPNKHVERRNSFTDLQDSFKKISKKLSLKPFSSISNQKTDVNRNGSGDDGVTLDFIENDDEENSDNSDEYNKASHTITDPTYPMCNVNGQPVSQSFFQEFIEKYYKLWGDNGPDEFKKNPEIAQLIEEFKEFDSELKKLDESLREDSKNIVNSSTNTDTNLNIECNDIEENLSLIIKSKMKTPMDKKSMSLPLKPLTDSTNTMDSSTNPTAMSSVSVRKQPGAIPLTPLMAKLSVLALNDDRSTWDLTPGANIEIQTPLTATTKIFTRRSSLKCDDAVDALTVNTTTITTTENTSTAKDNLQRAELYVCGQQNMTLLLLMEEGTACQQQVVQRMFEICVAKFPHMESHLNQTLNVSVEGDKHEGGYSFMCIDTKYDALQRNGAWNPMELNTLEYMHKDLLCENEVTDLILRSHDTLFYGYNSGRREFFYKEPVHQISGIPPPSDPMGNVGTRAKTRLERDHSYILF